MELDLVLTSVVFPAVTAILTVVASRWLEKRKAGDTAAIQEDTRRQASLFDAQSVALNELLVVVGEARETARRALDAVERGWWREHNARLGEMYNHSRSLGNVLIQRRGALPKIVHTAGEELRDQMLGLARHATADEDVLPDYASPKSEYLTRLKEGFTAIDGATIYLAGVLHSFLGISQKPNTELTIGRRLGTTKNPLA